MPASAYFLTSLSVRLNRYASSVSNNGSLAMPGCTRDSENEHATGTEHDHKTRNSKLTKCGNESSWVVLYFDK